MSDDLIFEEPPKLHGGFVKGSSSVGQWLKSLRDHPGQWAKYPEPKSAATATEVRKGRGYGVAEGEFEVRTVKIAGTTKCTIYARFVGTPELSAVEAS